MADGGGSASLDSYGQNGVQGRLCPRIDHTRQYWVNVFTGERRPDSCRANVCPHCGPRNAFKKALIISHGGASGAPERFATLTRAPQDWDKLRQKMRNLPRYLARRGFDGWECAWTVETTKAGVPHVHALQKGPYVPQRELQACWGSIVDIRAVKRPKDAQRATAYAFKEARRVAGYTTKGASSSGGVRSHLQLNGGRLVHVSRGYLGGWTQEQTWDEIQGARQDTGWRLVTA